MIAGTTDAPLQHTCRVQYAALHTITAPWSPRTHLGRALDGRVLSVAEAVEAVLKDGYVRSSPEFRGLVNQILIDTPVFHRVAPGRYTLKAGVKPTSRRRGAP